MDLSFLVWVLLDLFSLVQLLPFLVALLFPLLEHFLVPWEIPTVSGEDAAEAFLEVDVREVVNSMEAVWRGFEGVVVLGEAFSFPFPFPFPLPDLLDEEVSEKDLKVVEEAFQEVFGLKSAEETFQGDLEIVEEAFQEVFDREVVGKAFQEGLDQAYQEASDREVSGVEVLL